MKKKLFKTIMAFALVAVCAMAIPVVGATASAAEISAPGTGNTNMTYEVQSTYMVTIPDTLEINASTKKGNLNIGVKENAFIPYQHTINIKLSTCDFEITNGDDSLTYSIKDGETPVSLNGIVHTHSAGNLNASSNDLTVEITDIAKYSGVYGASIGFTVSLDAPAEA